MQTANSQIKEKLSLIDQKLDFLLLHGADPKGRLYEAARYLLLAPGKRLRPLLTLAVTEMLNGEIAEAIVAGCAIEMVHTYSLIHDDLPAMDNDDFRRGQPSMHKAYDEATAILVGDFLLTYAFEVLATQTQLSDSQKLLLISSLAKASGGKGMVAGQILDIQGIDQNNLTQVHSLKTAALFQAAFAFGAIIASVSSVELQKISHLGHEFGLLFQLADDLADGEIENQALALQQIEEKKCYLLNHLPSLELQEIIENLIVIELKI